MVSLRRRLYLLQLLLCVEELRHAADQLGVHEERLAVAGGGGQEEGAESEGGRCCHVEDEQRLENEQ